jgi:hypothetical protein
MNIRGLVFYPFLRKSILPNLFVGVAVAASFGRAKSPDAFFLRMQI